MHCQNLIFCRIYESKSPTYIHVGIYLTKPTKVHKTVLAQSSFYENKVLSQNLSPLTLGEVPCLYIIKIMHNTVLKMNGLLES